MASIQKCSFHVRSISLPTTSHPLVVNVEDHLCRLRATEATSSASSVCHSLDNLKNLCDSVHDMMQLPMTQQSFSQEGNGKLADEILDGSLRLLNVCSTAKDVVLQMKESDQDLKSSLRRRRGTGSDLATDAEAYMVSRKKTNKIISRCLKNLKSSEKTYPSTLLDKDSNLVSIINMLREVEAISLSSLKSLLCYVSGSQAKSSGWSLISKMVQPKHKSCKTEISDLESLISTLHKQKLNKDVELVQIVMNQLDTSELAIQELENGLDSVLKCLLKTRVSFLNMLN